MYFFIIISIEYDFKDMKEKLFIIIIIIIY